MEARERYDVGPAPSARPRLIVVNDGAASYSALPHAVLFSELSDGAVRLYAILQAHWWGESGESTASHATLAAEARCSLKSVRRHLDELIAAGLVAERPAGTRRSKIYAPIPIGQKRPIEAANTAEMSDCPPSNAPKTTVQSDKNDRSNAPKTTYSYKKTPVKKTLEEELPPTGVGAAAAPQPATGDKPKRSAQRKTACPETFPLDAKHFAYGSELGLSEQRVRAETDKFLAHHRFKGTLGLDWYAGWQNWMRRAVLYDAQQPSPHRNGTGIPPGAASKQTSSWADFKGRHGGNLIRRPEGRTDGR